MFKSVTKQELTSVQEKSDWLQPITSISRKEVIIEMCFWGESSVFFLSPGADRPSSLIRGVVAAEGWRGCGVCCLSALWLWAMQWVSVAWLFVSYHLISLRIPFKNILSGLPFPQTLLPLTRSYSPCATVSLLKHHWNVQCHFDGRWCVWHTWF